MLATPKAIAWWSTIDRDGLLDHIRSGDLLAPIFAEPDTPVSTKDYGATSLDSVEAFAQMAARFAAHAEGGKDGVIIATARASATYVLSVCGALSMCCVAGRSKC